jgi:hypothetical protein
MRNEFAEMFQPVRRVARSLNKDEKQVSAKRNGGMRGKKRKRSVDRRGDQVKKTGKGARRSLLRRRRDGSLLAEEALSGGQAEKGRQAVWNPEQGERDPLCCFSSSIAREPFSPRQTIMRPLGPRDRLRGRSRGPGESWLHLDLQVLAMQTQASVSLVPSVPVSPEKWGRANRQGIKQDAHLARFGGGPPVPLALVA